jgi:hypothetical protein
MKKEQTKSGIRFNPRVIRMYDVILNAYYTNKVPELAEQFIKLQDFYDKYHLLHEDLKDN